jgi:hypothetical protein
VAKLISKNQITLPKAVVKPTDGKELRKIRARAKAAGLTERDVRAAIRWARSRDV